jgi:tRNA (adenine57-N1/adenine58-N1)-methyltransferase
MTIRPASTVVLPGDLIQLVSPSNKTYFVRVNPGGELHTHRGVVKFDDLIGTPWGSQVFSHLGSTFFLLQPSLADLIKETRRNTQIMYPKDIGFILLTMNIGPGAHVVEAGTGSGAMTTALAWAVGAQGKVTSYDSRPEVQNLARKNLERLNLAANVSLKLGDISEGFDEHDVDALFLDLPNPYDYIAQVRATLKPGGFFGCILPTVNQVERLLYALYQFHFSFTDVCEILLRYYKPVHNRLRPTDRMIAHTGYLVFSRPIVSTDNVSFQDIGIEESQELDPPHSP